MRVIALLLVPTGLAAAQPTQATPDASAPWRYDVRIGAHATGMENLDGEAENGVPHGAGLCLDLETGPRPRWNELAASLTVFGEYARFTWADAAMYPDSYFKTSHFNFVDIGVRGNVHLGPVRLGIGTGIDVGFAGSQGGILPMVEAVASIDVPTGTRMGASVLAVAQCALCIPDGWASARISAGVTF